MKLINAIFISTLFSLVVVTAKKTGGGGSTGGSSSSGGGGGSYSKPGPSPTTAYTPTSSTTNNPPSSSTTNKAPTNGQYGPTYSSDVSYNNPNPAYKPQTPAGAPTMSSGGGGYNYQPRGYSSGGSGLLTGLLLGSFLYGGMYSSPSCRGGYDYSGYCNYGTSTANHQCPQQIPLCPIPQNIRDQWYIGSTTNIEVIADKSTCSSASPNLGPDPAANTATTSTLPPVVVDDDSNNETTAMTSADIVPASTNGTVAASPNNTTNNNTFALVDCTDAIVASGTCSSSKRFTYDEISGKCKCCDAGAELIPWDYSSAVYVYSSSNPLELYGPPSYCLSGSTLYYPKKSSNGTASTTTTITTTTTTTNTSSADAAAVSGGSSFYTDEQYSCNCGECKECGDPKVSYMDWNGPFVVPDELGMTATSTVSDKPLYDPVDTCTCNVGGPQCAEQYQEQPPSEGSSGNTNTIRNSTESFWVLISTFLVSLLAFSSFL